MQSLSSSYTEKVESVVASRNVSDPLVKLLALDFAKDSLKLRLILAFSQLHVEAKDKPEQTTAHEYSKWLWAHDQALVAELCEDSADQGIARAFTLKAVVEEYINETHMTISRKQLALLLAAFSTAAGAAAIGGEHAVTFLNELIQNANQK